MVDVLSASDYAAGRLQGDADGSVHSAFSSSFNVMLDGFLLHVGTEAAPLSCLGCTVDAEGMSHLLGQVEPGDRVHLRRGVLRVYSRATVSELALGAACVRPMAVEPVAPSALAGADERLSDALAACGLVERTGLPWPDCSAAVTSLARYSISLLCLQQGMEGAEIRRRCEAAERAMRGAVAFLVGRGLGLTPSGDDVLAGFGTALRFLYGSAGLARCRPFFEAVAAAAPGRTTAVAEAYLAAMVAGYANADYLDLLGAIASGDWGQVPSRLDPVLAVGHTSGADSLLGFAAAFGCLY